MPAARRIALFGGTFDPVHLGHLAMATNAKEQLQLDEIRFLPCRISPHKQDRRPTPAVQRLKLLGIATAGLDWAIVDDFELHQPEPSYSWATAEAMKAKYPGSQLFWIMGSDQWQALDRWDQPERLAACVEFVVFHRNEQPQPRQGFRLHALDAIHPANATEIREQLAQGKSQHPWLNDAVAAYAFEKALYVTTS